MNQTTQATQTPAASLLSQFEARGVELRVENTTVLIGDSAVPFKRIQMRGGVRLPGDFEKIDRVKSGLVRILESKGKTEMSVGDTQEPSFIATCITDKSSARRGASPKEAQSEAPEGQEPLQIAFAPYDPTKAVLPQETPQNWAKPLPKKQIRNRPSRGGRRASMDSFMLGNTFGKWLVLSKVEARSPKGQILWLCRCECGTIREVMGSSLRRPTNGSTSCGCAPIRNSKTDWAKVDWSMSDQQLGEKYGCGRVTAWRQRMKHAPQP